MYVLEPPEDLINEELYVVIGELLGLDYVVEVSTHQRRHQVSVGKEECNSVSR